jgi:hypothetical protein
MRNEEAIEILNENKPSKSLFDMTPDEINFNSALAIAINSILRVIPKEVEKNDMTIDEEEYLCPTCKEVVKEYYTKPPFCNNKSCGQAFKW